MIHDRAGTPLGVSNTSTSTAPADRPEADVRRMRDYRRAGIAVLSVFILLGALGFYGVRSSTVEADGGGFELAVKYPRVARAGLAVDVEVEVRKPDGFDEAVTLRVGNDYFSLFDENAFDPSPTASYIDDRGEFLEFEPPAGSTVMYVRVDTRVEPARQMGKEGVVAVVDEAGNDVVSVSFRTWLMP